MPKNMLLMTPYYEFSLVDFPEMFLDLQQIYYKRKCCYCDKERVDSATCLLCGNTMCWPTQQSGKCSGKEFTENSFATEGVLSYHTRYHEGGSSIFL
jgi:hypothetical protein